MINVLMVLYWLLLWFLFMTWGGYYLFLVVLDKIKSFNSVVQYNSKLSQKKPLLTVVIAAKNEEKNIVQRINNLIDQNYPLDKLEIIVASDGSTDRTVLLSEEIGDQRIQILDFKINRGRAVVHNEAVRSANGEIVLFTDAETEFEQGFLEKIVKPFQDPEVGAVVGRIVYSNALDSGVTAAAGRYWNYEAHLRLLESNLDMLSFATGACSAFRKILYQELNPTEDIDYAQTLNVIIQGYKIKMVPEARAIDLIAGEIKQTFKNRVRQTSRAFTSITARLFSHQILLRPPIFLSILFHKTLRHLTPFLLIAVLGLNAFLYNEGLIYTILLLTQISFYFLSVIGLLINENKNIPKILLLPSNFVLINIGRFFGVIKALSNKQKATY
ncbi:hypothetical protein C6A37_04010 [Desulfobacteraceae bacterium SEEP-SAG9]|nr:hypothetical protein C6A37_04010 [Desulfobacteraceae bacterium SEEP-SAG9]